MPIAAHDARRAHTLQPAQRVAACNCKVLSPRRVHAALIRKLCASLAAVEPVPSRLTLFCLLLSPQTWIGARRAHCTPRTECALLHAHCTPCTPLARQPAASTSKLAFRLPYACQPEPASQPRTKLSCSTAAVASVHGSGNYNHCTGARVGSGMGAGHPQRLHGSSGIQN